MSHPSKLRAFVATLVFTGALGLGVAHAADASLADWQPCPDSLAVEGGAPPPKKWDLTLSPYTHHWSNNPEHKQVMLVALDCTAIAVNTRTRSPSTKRASPQPSFRRWATSSPPKIQHRFSYSVMPDFCSPTPAASEREKIYGFPPHIKKTASWKQNASTSLAPPSQT